MLRFFAQREKNALLQNPDVNDNIKEKYEKATFGDSWLKSFKERHNIRGKVRINGERASLPSNDELMLEIRTFIKKSGIPIKNIYNCDETGLFYRSMPNYTHAETHDDGAGGKRCKRRITLMFLVNGDGSDKQIIMVGTSKTPRGTSSEFFNSHDIKYFSNKNAWMTKEIFEKFLKDFDSRMKEPTILLLDNFSGHSFDVEDGYKYVIPLFLPKNTASSTQPLDGGIISSFKVKYRRFLMEYVVDRVKENNFNLKEISVQKITPWIKKSFNELNPCTIQKCFFNTLKLEMFEIKESEKDLNFNHDISKLSNLISTYTGNDLQPLEVYEFAVDPNENMIESDIENQEEELDDKIPDPNHLVKQLDLFNSYFINTGCIQEVKYVKYLREKLISHLNFK